MIPQETINAIIETARIEEVVREFVSLSKSGSNYVGICPFHKEKTPSFIVSPAKNIFKCFGCGKAGDSVRFIMEHEHYTYPEALRYLAQKYGIIIEEKEKTPEEIKLQSEREEMFNVNSFAQKYFSDILHNNETGNAIGMSYLYERDFKDAIINKFQLGFCLDNKDAFAQHAIRNGYSKDILLKTGLCTGNEERLYDRFQGRVIFPIHNLTGKVVGFGGRILTNDKTKAKYLNSPESEIYNKSKTLYGIYFAKNEIIRQDNCILVEGYADVISMHQAGFENVVASSGTSLTKEQILLISRYTKNVTMLYDGDAAGLKAALRGTDMILEEGMNVKVVVLPPEEDPDSFARHNSATTVEQYLKDNAKDFIEFKTILLLKDSTNDPVKKAEVTRDILESVSVIPDAIYRATYIKKCSQLLDIAEQTLMNELNKLLRAKIGKIHKTEQELPEVEPITVRKQHNPEDDLQNKSLCQEKELVRLLLNHGNKFINLEMTKENGSVETVPVSVASLIIEDLKNDRLIFKDELNKQIFNTFDEFLKNENIPDYHIFTTNNDEAMSNYASNLLLSNYKLDDWKRHNIFVTTEDDLLLQTISSSLLRYKDMILEERRAELLKEIAAANNDEDLMILLKKKKELDEIKSIINDRLGIVITQ